MHNLNDRGLVTEGSRRVKAGSDLNVLFVILSNILYENILGID